MAVVGTAEVLVRPTFSGFQRAVGKQMQGLGPQGEQVGRSLASRVSGGFKKAAAVGLAAAGGVAVAGLGAALTKGLGRLTAIENAQAKMRGLGHDTKTVDEIMKNALASVKGTAFGLGEAATAAASAVAAGIEPGEKLTGHLTNVANTAAAAGTSFEEMGSIFNRAATQANGVQNDVISQLADRGIPIYQALADQMGVTAGEVFKLASEGKVDFETFSKAAEQAAGTVADEMGKTFTGSLANAWAALGRVGANLLSGVFEKFAPAVQGVTDWLGKLEPVATRVGEAIGEFANRIIDWFGEIRRSPVLAWLRDGFEGLQKVFTGGGTGQLAKWLGVDQGHAVIGFLQGIRDFVTQDIPAGFEFLKGVIQGVFNVFTQQGTGLLASTLGVSQDHWIIGLFRNLREAAVNVFTYIRDEAIPAIAGFIEGFRDGEGAGGRLRDTLERVVGVFQAVVGVVRDVVVPVLRDVWAVIQDYVLPVLGEVVAFIVDRLWPDVVGALESHVLPAFREVGETVQVMWREYAEPALRALWGFIKDVLLPFIIDFYENGIKPTFKLIGDAIAWAWTNVIKPALFGILDGAKATFGWIKDTGWPWLRDAFQNMSDKATALKDGVVGAWDSIKGGISRGWDTIKGIFDRFKDGLDSVKEKFSDVRDGIGRIWATIGGMIARPINKVIDAVNSFTGGLAENLSKIPGVSISIPKIPHVPVPSVPKDNHGVGGASTGGVFAADGGMIPGWSPHDRADNIPAWLTAGEYVLPVAATRRLRQRFGGGFLEQLRQGLPGYASGGLVGGRGGSLGDALMDGGRFLLDLFRSPLSTLRGFAERAFGALGDSLPLQIAKGVAGDAIGKLVTWVKEKLFGGEDGSPARAVGPPMAFPMIAALVRALVPDARITSTFRPGAITAGYGTRSLHALGRAVDFVSSDMVGATRLLSQLKGWTELIHTPAGRWQQAAGRSFTNFAPITKQMHYDHVHVGMADGGLVRPFVADSGVRLAPGLNVLDNRTGGPEPLGRLDQPLDLSADTIEGLRREFKGLLDSNRRALVRELALAGRGRGGGGGV